MTRDSEATDVDLEGLRAQFLKQVKEAGLNPVQQLALGFCLVLEIAGNMELTTDQVHELLQGSIEDLNQDQEKDADENAALSRKLAAFAQRLRNEHPWIRRVRLITEGEGRGEHELLH